MKRLFVVGATVGLLSLAAPLSASAEGPSLTTAKDDAVCIALEPKVGACVGSPVPTLQQLLRNVPDSPAR